MTPNRIPPLLLLPLLAACAKQEPPPGTHPDDTPPRPVQLRPEYGASVAGFDGYAKVQFDEPLSNPRNLTRSVTGSPAGRYEVKPGRSGVEVRPADGWRDGVVYYLKLEAGVSDLLRNRTLAPIEWLFAVGGEVPPTEVSGRVVDRVTGRGTRGLRVLFLGADSIPYTAVSDTGGVFEIPGLPFGSYEAVGFNDQNRNFVYDSEFEPGGSTDFSLSDVAHEAELRVIVLPADTTPPVLAEAQARDSVTLQLEFDDPLDPDVDLGGASLTVRDSVSGEAFDVDTFVVGALPPTAGPVAAEEAPAEAAAADTTGIAPDSLVRPDSLVAPDSMAAAGEAAPARAGPEMTPASTRVNVRLARPLGAGTYVVEASGFPNLRGLEGGGEASFRYEPPPPREEAEPADAGEDGEAGASDEAPAGEDQAGEDQAGEDQPGAAPPEGEVP